MNQDPRSVGDRNPGAANTFKIAGKQLGAVVLVLDFLKALIPVMIAKWRMDLTDSGLLLVALAPSIGHSFSVFLGFKGGRGLTALFGVWTGITLHELPMIMGVTAGISVPTIKNDELKTLAIPIVVIVYLLASSKPQWMVILAILQLLVVLLKVGHFYLRNTNANH